MNDSKKKKWMKAKYEQLYKNVILSDFFSVSLVSEYQRAREKFKIECQSCTEIILYLSFF